MKPATIAGNVKLALRFLFLIIIIERTILETKAAIIRG
jgi:hypothetical protein